MFRWLTLPCIDESEDYPVLINILALDVSGMGLGHFHCDGLE